MGKVFTYICIFTLFTFQGEAKRLNEDGFLEITADVVNFEDVELFNLVEIISWLIVFGFFVNLFPFINWVKKQKSTSELMMYQVRGRFTYFSVIAWMDAIENGVGKTFKNKRILLANFQVRSAKRNKPYILYKYQVEKALYLLAFGNTPRRTAFGRMQFYPKLVYVWSIIIFFIPINYAVYYFWDKAPYLAAVLMGVVSGIVPSLFLFNIFKKIYNLIMQSVGNNWIKARGDAGYLHELMHQFSGVYNGYWNTLNWDDTTKADISGLDNSEETLEYIKFTFFKGKGSQGSW